MNVGCDTTSCFSCHVFSNNYFTLDGRNYDSPIDQNYTLEHSGWSDSIYWRGFQSSLIVKNETNRQSPPLHVDV